MPFDPLALTLELQRIVCRNNERKYYRFRPARFYGGIITADCVGCNLRCAFCWAWSVLTQPERSGRWYTPQQVAARLLRLSRLTGYRQLRLSGNEPTLCKPHLLTLLEELRGKGIVFILETNGILIGADASYAKDLARFRDFLHVRVSLKACNEKEFERITGAKSEAFKLQLKALENLVAEGVPCHPSVMISFSTAESFAVLCARLAAIKEEFAQPEVEEVVNWGGAFERLKRLNIHPSRIHEPSKIPPEQI